MPQLRVLTCYGCVLSPSMLPAAGTQPYVLETPDMFIFHHVNGFQAPAGDAGQQLLVLDTVGWDAISFESSQHNLSTEYYVGEHLL